MRAADAGVAVGGEHDGPIGADHALLRVAEAAGERVLGDYVIVGRANAVFRAGAEAVGRPVAPASAARQAAGSIAGGSPSRSAAVDAREKVGAD